jgi:very-short-patch-repair endonuclease
MTYREIVRARRLRKSATPAERTLWTVLRGRGFEELKFRRQVPIGRYTVDFACLEHRIVVELDGGIHDAAIYDLGRQIERDDWLAKQGFTVLRFRNSEVGLPHRILQRVLEHCRARTPHPSAPPTPSPARGEGDL